MMNRSNQFIENEVESNSFDEELGKKLIIDTVIKTPDELVHVEPIINQAIQKWFADTQHKVPAIICDKGVIYLLPRAERSPAEAVEYANLVRIVAKEFNRKPRQVPVMRNPLETAIKRQDPERLEEEKRKGSKLITSLVERGIEMQATDMHMHIVDDVTTIKYRVFGRVVDDQVFDGSQGETIAIAMFNKHVKGAFDGSPARKGFFHHYYKGEKWMCRVSYGRSPETNNTTKMVIRFRSMDEIPKIYDLGYEPNQIRDIMIGMNNRGFLMIIGAVNSGKSTTQAAIMEMQPSDQINLEISAETEVMFKNFTQLVLPNQGTEAQLKEWRKRMTALPMQQDVDFLAVNEINSPETANMIASMMMQGTSGISSIHGSGAGDAINRLKNKDELGISEQILFSDSFFKMVIYQTLVGTLCQFCALTEHPVGFWNSELKKWFGERASNFRFHNKAGCAKCEKNGKRLGVTGRTLVAEVIPITQENRDYLKTPDNSQPMRDWMNRTNRYTIHRHALLLAYRGIIDPISVQEKIGQFSRHNLFENIFSRNEVGELDEPGY